jgi:hypothetical protein
MNVLQDGFQNPILKFHRAILWEWIQEIKLEGRSVTGVELEASIMRPSSSLVRERATRYSKPPIDLEFFKI